MLIDQTKAHTLIRDPGSGFDLTMMEANQEAHPGIGLVTSRERLRLLGGSMQIESTPGAGTSILKGTGTTGVVSEGSRVFYSENLTLSGAWMP